jgi:hypothetical protein
VTGTPDWPTPAPPVRPAIGGRLGRKALVWQATIAVVLVLVLGIAKHVVAAGKWETNNATALVGLDVHTGAPSAFLTSFMDNASS